MSVSVQLVYLGISVISVRTSKLVEFYFSFAPQKNISSEEKFVVKIMSFRLALVTR